ncbi:hypothetical protein P22_1543 [Propionispora sp. 2/2-37]|uniref:aminoacyl-tRNA hydrolase n=1 Tax=Propionispora sp. 2/2-37 TaxID=1677858 RepID=UPI0006BB8459|nr:aminoacyl-tRNA hydrolase [Propionispora sp. 2/2-37]CUH95472.1 hypothetical protein P22_1543 [Propionispora sp. 2/2-37]
MKMIVGLGNPGQKYEATRHNVGFMVIDELAKRWGIASWRTRNEASVAEKRQAEQILLVKPLTYMNLSGVAVGELARWYKIAVTDIIVVFDDMDLATGRLRLRTTGSSGGHRGVESLLVHLPSADFFRVRVGIGRPPAGWQVVDHVLSRFTAEEEPLATDGIKRAAAAVECLLEQGINKAMNRYN